MQQAQLEEELCRAREGRVWSRVREEEGRRERAELERDTAVARNAVLEADAASRNRGRAVEHQELIHARHLVTVPLVFKEMYVFS